MLSFWERGPFTNYDIAIVGAGIAGLSTAIELKEKNADLNIIVLERGLLPTGASTKNAGFACVGSLTEILDDLERMDAKEAVDLVKMRYEGLSILRNRLGDDAIGYQENGSYELCFDEIDYLPRIEYVNDLLKPVFEKAVFSISDKSFGFNKSVKSIIESSVEGEVDTGKMMKSLHLLAMSKGIEIKTGYNINSIDQTENGIRLTNGTLSLKAKKVCICTNAFASSLLPDIKIAPGRGQVLITNPIKGLPFKGIYHFAKGYYYFRTINNRVLFGGGRHLDFEGETTKEFGLNHAIQSDLETKLKEVILPDTKFEIAYRWSGIMAFGENKIPVIKKVDNNLYAAVRFGGMGVAIGSKAARILADKVLAEL